jgi:hypothetical protein
MMHQMALPPISLTAFDVLWRDWCKETGQRILPMPVVLDCPSPGSTPARRAAVERWAREELWRTGYLEDRDTVHRMLAALAAPDIEINLRWDGGSPGRSVAVRRQQLPVVARQAWHTVAGPAGPAVVPKIQFYWGEPTHLAADLVDLVPRRQAARVPGGELTLRLASLHAARREIARGVGEHPWSTVRRRLRDAGENDNVSRTFADLATVPCLGRGEFGMAGRTPAGERRTGPIVRLHDTAKGRYLLIHRSDLVTVRGADTTSLLARLAADQADLTG